MINSVVADPTAHARFLWRNGEIVPWEEANVHVTAVGHGSVASVFEGLKAYWSDRKQQLFCFRLREHMERLISSARLARIQCSWSVDQMVESVLELLRGK